MEAFPRVAGAAGGKEGSWQRHHSPGTCTLEYDPFLITKSSFIKSCTFIILVDQGRWQKTRRMILRHQLLDSALNSISRLQIEGTSILGLVSFCWSDHNNIQRLGEVEKVPSSYALKNGGIVTPQQQSHSRRENSRSGNKRREGPLLERQESPDPGKYSWAEKVTGFLQAWTTSGPHNRTR